MNVRANDGSANDGLVEGAWIEGDGVEGDGNAHGGTSRLATDDARRRAVWQKSHLQYLGMSLAVLVLAFVLTTPDNERVDLPGGWTVPELCAMKAWTGWTCPGCGLTRSFVHVFDGRWEAAYAMHPLGPLFVGVVVAQIPYRIWRIGVISRGGVVEGPRWTKWFGRTLIAALILRWLIAVGGEAFMSTAGS